MSNQKTPWEIYKEQRKAKAEQWKQYKKDQEKLRSQEK